jgi:hypothetical protein
MRYVYLALFTLPTIVLCSLAFGASLIVVLDHCGVDRQVADPVAWGCVGASFVAGVDLLREAVRK